MELIPLSLEKIMQSQSYTAFILSSESIRFAIYTEPHIGENIQIHLTKAPIVRPKTHDLLNSIFTTLDVKILQAVIHDVEDTIYFAKLYLEQIIDGKKHILEIDTRPSDCLTIALENDIPLFCNRGLLKKVVPIQDEED